MKRYRVEWAKTVAFTYVLAASEEDAEERAELGEGDYAEIYDSKPVVVGAEEIEPGETGYE